MGNHDSFNNLSKWYELISENSILADPFILIMANKCDIKGKVAVTKEEMDQMVHNIPKSMVVEVSARSGSHVLESIEKLCIKMAGIKKSTLGGVQLDKARHSKKLEEGYGS